MSEIELTADGATIHVQEKVSTGDYENADVAIDLDVEISGADVTHEIPDELKQKLWGIGYELQVQVEQLARKRAERSL